MWKEPKEMEVLFDVIERGNLKILLSVQDNHGYIVIITANDKEDRRVFKAPVLENGKVKTFESPEAAILAAKTRLLSTASQSISAESSSD
jgi:hypothetical protein